MLAEVAHEEAGVSLREEPLDSLSPRPLSLSLCSFVEGKLGAPIGEEPCIPGKLNPGNPNRGFVRPIPARPPKGKNMGGFVDEVDEAELVVVDVVLDFGGSMKNFMLGKPLSIPVFAKLSGFRPAEEGNDMVVTGGTRF